MVHLTRIGALQEGDGMVPEHEEIEFHMVHEQCRRVFQRFTQFDDRGLPVELVQVREQPVEDPKQVRRALSALYSGLEALHSSFREQFEEVSKALLEGVQVDSAVVREVTDLIGRLASLQDAVATSVETQVEQDEKVEHLNGTYFQKISKVQIWS